MERCIRVRNIIFEAEHFLCFVTKLPISNLDRGSQVLVKMAPNFSLGNFKRLSYCVLSGGTQATFIQA